MPELFLELFSEEIPARMQARGGRGFGRLCGEALAQLAPANVRTFFGPRRIALAADVASHGRRQQHGGARPAHQCARTGACRLPAQAQCDTRAVAPGGRLLGAGEGRCRDPRRHADRRRIPAVAAPLPLAEVDALGRVPATSSGSARCAASSACSTARWCRSTCATARTMGTGWRRPT